MLVQMLIRDPREHRFYHQVKNWMRDGQPLEFGRCSEGCCLKWWRKSSCDVVVATSKGAYQSHHGQSGSCTVAGKSACRSDEDAASREWSICARSLLRSRRMSFLRGLEELHGKGHGVPEYGGVDNARKGNSCHRMRSDWCALWSSEFRILPRRRTSGSPCAVPGSTAALSTLTVQWSCHPRVSAWIRARRRLCLNAGKRYFQ